MPDSTKEWYALRRRIRGAEVTEPGAPFWRTPLAWLAAPLAAAAVALVVLLPSGPNGASANGKAAAIARVESVEAPGGNASTMVFVDDKSGWLIVWASDANGQSG